MPSIRRMLESDISAISELYSQLGYPASPELLRDRFLKILPRLDHAILVTLGEAGDVAGVVHVRLDESLHLGSTAEVTALVVAESCRGSGLGRALMEAAEVWAAANGANDVWLLSNVTREKAHAFYLGIGYTTSKSARLFKKAARIS
jgi:GNAT superfamily N-acetyltransferase